MGKRLTLAITGASGSGFGVAVLRRLAANPEVERVTLLTSATGRRCLREECGLSEPELGALSVKILVQSEKDLAPPSAAAATARTAWPSCPAAPGPSAASPPA